MLDRDLRTGSNVKAKELHGAQEAHLVVATLEESSNEVTLPANHGYLVAVWGDTENISYEKHESKCLSLSQYMETTPASWTRYGHKQDIHNTDLV